MFEAREVASNKRAVGASVCSGGDRFFFPLFNRGTAQSAGRHNRRGTIGSLAYGDCSPPAEVAELADALASGASDPHIIQAKNIRSLVMFLAYFRIYTNS